MSAEDIRVEIEPAGFDHELVDRLRNAVQEHQLVRDFLREAEYRLLDLQPYMRDLGKDAGERDEEWFRATLYDYTNDRALEAIGRVDQLDEIEIADYARQPLPSAEEFELAFHLLSQDPGW